MNAHIPSAEEVRHRLQAMTHAQVQELSSKSGAPFTTIWKIRSGETSDPRVTTVRAIWPHLSPSKAKARA